MRPTAANVSPRSHLQAVSDEPLAVADWVSSPHTLVSLIGSDDGHAFFAALSRELAGFAIDTNQSTLLVRYAAVWASADGEPPAVDRAIEQLCAETVLALLQAELIRAELDDAHTEIGQLRGALISNRDIGVAMGILMTQQLISRDEAFHRLRSASQHRHLKLRDVAEQVIETGCLPSCAKAAAAV